MPLLFFKDIFYISFYLFFLTRALQLQESFNGANIKQFFPSFFHGIRRYLFAFVFCFQPQRRECNKTSRENASLQTHAGLVRVKLE
jgi:hypothetical protein